MKWNSKKLMALVLSASMIMGSSTVAFAAGTDDDTTPAEGTETDTDTSSAEGTASGTGALEGTVETDVFSVVVPTESSTAFNFILDPEGLIAKTESAHYTGKTFEESANLFFARSDTDKEYDYTSSSDRLTVTNKSTTPVSVALKATVDLTAADGVTTTNDNTFAGDTTASIYLALTDGTNAAAIDATEGASITANIAAAPADAYEFGYDENSGYTYELKSEDDLSAADITFPDYSFYLTGAANSAGDWSELGSAAPSVSVTWTIAKTDNTAPSISGTTTFTAETDTPVVVSVNLGTGDAAATGIASLTYVNASGATKTVSTTDYAYEDGSLTLSASAVNVFVESVNATRTYTITFDDSAATTASFTINKN